jgi:hypothetical protein
MVMGMEQTVIFAGKPVPSWTAARDLLAARGIPTQLQMIDSQLSLPDEAPPDAWSELRFHLPGGMVTVRRDGERLIFVTWDNADEALRQAWNALTWAFAAAGWGEVLTAVGKMSLTEFQARAELPPTIQSLF